MTPNDMLERLSSMALTRHLPGSADGTLGLPRLAGPNPCYVLLVASYGRRIWNCMGEIMFVLPRAGA